MVAPIVRFSADSIVCPVASDGSTARHGTEMRETVSRVGMATNTEASVPEGARERKSSSSSGGPSSAFPRACGPAATRRAVRTSPTTPTTQVTHVAMQEALDGKAVEWLEHVTDEQYTSNRSNES